MRDSRWHLARETPRAMPAGEFLWHLWRHKRGCFDSCGIRRNRWGDRIRDEFSMPAMGTLWFSTPARLIDVWLVPANWFPYVSIQDLVLTDESAVRYSGEITRGWRSALAALLEEGYLQPSPQLSRLIGEDSFERAQSFTGFLWEKAA